MENDRKERLHKVLRNKQFMTGFLIIVIFFLCAIFAPLLAPNDPYEVNPAVAKQLHVEGFPLGTDEFGRCILSRLLYGARTTLALTVLSLLIAMAIGIPLGLMAGYFKRLDGIIMRLMDLLMAFPGILLAIAIVAILGTGVYNVTIAVGIGTVPTIARMVRGCVLPLKTQQYIEASKLCGASDFRIMFRHILPNCISTIIVFSVLQLAWIMLSISTLSFLGMGAQSPTAEWGAMASGGRNYIMNAFHISTIPVICIVICIIGFNMLGNGIRDILDPRMKAK